MSHHTAFNTAAEFHKNCEGSVMARKPGDEGFSTVYHGCTVPFPFNLGLSELETFEARSGDICITSFPKTGQTLTAALVLMIQSDANPDSLRRGPPLKLRVPYLEMAFPRDGKWNDPVYPIQHLKGLIGSRIYGTHHNAYTLPAQVVDTAKIVYVYRNPKDTIVSMYHFFVSGKRAFGFEGTLADVVDMMLNDQCLFAPFFEHIEGFWKRRDQKNIHITSYEKILKDPNTEVRALARFLGKELDAGQVSDVVHHCSFEEMKNNSNTNFSEFETIGFIDLKVSPFMRSGQIGNWKLHLTPELNEKVSRWIESNFAQRPELVELKFDYE